MPRSLGPTTTALAAAAFTAGVLRRMKTEYQQRETFTRTTVTLLYSAYAATGTAFAWAARRRGWPLRLPRRLARLAGTALTLTGATVAIAGATRFGSGAQLSGIEPGSLVTGGLYRHTRNPQYLGLTAVLAGLALATRSGLAAAITAAAWAAFNNWIPSEERHLEHLFGDHYRTYAAHTRRWLRSRRGRLAGSNGPGGNLAPTVGRRSSRAEEAGHASRRPD